MTVRYCARCVYPDTKPDLQLDAAGVCSACRAYASRATVDWDARRAQLLALLDRYRTPDGYDCLVPVSGGKDSMFQVRTMLDLGARPLAVTATTDHLTPLGRRNLVALQHLGVDHVTVTPNPVLRYRLNRYCLETVGDISWPEHVAIFTIPVQVAVRYGIPLIIWGENSQHEYGGPATAQQASTLTNRWLQEFGGLLGLRVADLPEIFPDVPARAWGVYQYPDDAALARVGVTGLFLGYFLPWDGQANAAQATAYGWSRAPGLVEGSLADYENLDNAQTGIHDYFKFLKFGFGRATDIACNLIRRGRLDRADAVRLVPQRERFPWTYLGVPLADVLARLGMTVAQFVAVCDRFTNPALFDGKHADGTPRLREPLA